MKNLFCKQTAALILAARLPLGNAAFVLEYISGGSLRNVKPKNLFFCKQTADRIPTARLPLGNAALVLEYFR